MCDIRWLPLFLLVFVEFGCGPAETVQDASESTSTTSQPASASDYHFLTTNTLSSEEAEEDRKSLPYDEIQLERTACYGSCPSYVVTFRRDGTASYVGRDYVENIGRFSGQISIFDYGKLCHAIEKFKLLQLQPNWYDSGMVDIPSTILRVKNKQTKNQAELGVRGLPGPIELWVVQSSIDNVASQIKWHVANDSLLNIPKVDKLITEVQRITLLTSNSSTLKERIRVHVEDAAMRTRCIKVLNDLEITSEGLEIRQDAEMRALDVELLILDHSGYEHSLGIYWENSDSGTVVYEGSEYQVSAGLKSLRQFIAKNSGLPEFGGLQPDIPMTK